GTLFAAAFEFERIWRLSTARRVASGSLPSTPENLKSAVRELRSYPDLYPLLLLANWIGVALVVALLIKILDVHAAWRLVGELWGLASALGPFVCLLSIPVVGERCRALQLEMAQIGLSPAQVVEALPVRRGRTRMMLVLFTATSVTIPAVLTIFLTRTL